MRKMKRLFSALLACVTLIGMVIIQADAAENYELSIVSAQTFPPGTTVYDASAPSATSVRQGEIVVLTVGFASVAASEIGAFGVQLYYDADRLEPYGLFNGASYQAGPDFSSGWTVLGNAQDNYVNIGGFAVGDAVQIAAGASAILGRFAFKVKSDAPDGVTRFTFDPTESYVSDGSGVELSPLGGLAAQSLTIEADTGYSGETGATREDVYAILYADKTLVFQYGNEPESGRTVRETYPVDLINGYYAPWNVPNVPWYDKRGAIQAVVFKDAIQPLSMAYWFYEFSSLESIQGLDRVDTSHVSNMQCLFYGCSKFTEMDLRGLDTSAVTDMNCMFQDCKRLASLNVSGWDTSHVRGMERMFCGCSRLATLDVSGWDTSNVDNMRLMFSGCSSLTKLDVGGWDTSHVDWMDGIFSGCSSLTELDVSRWDTSNAVYMFDMFSGCSSLTTLDVSRWDTSAVTDMQGMFYLCSALTALDVSGWNTSSVTNMENMFEGCSALTELDVSGWDTMNVMYMSGVFFRCSALTTLDVSGWDTSNVRSIGGIFAFCSGLTTLDVSAWDTFNVTTMSDMFWGCSGLTTLDVSGWDTAAVTMMHHMFADCSNLKTIYASEHFNLTDESIFDGCTSLVGGAGTTYDPSRTGAEYARIDNPPDAPGYFTYKSPSVERPPVTLTLKLRNSSGREVVMDDLRESVEIAPEVTLDGDASGEELKTADIFLIIYDSKGKMLSLQQWEVDLTNPLSFIRTAPIPQGVDASYVKFIMLSSNLTPLTAAQELS